MFGFIKKHPKIILPIIISSLMSYSLSKISDASFQIDKKKQLEILEKCKSIYSTNEIIKYIGKTKENIPNILIFDYKKHGIDTYTVEYTTLNSKNVDFDIKFISKILESNNKKETLNNKIELLKKYGYLFDENNEISIKENFKKLIEDKEFKINDVLANIAKNNPQTPFFINMSYSEQIENNFIKDSYNLINKQNILFNKEYLNNIDKIKTKNYNLIQTIYNNPNLHISKSSGNNISINIEKEEKLVKNYLNMKLLNFSDNNFEKYNQLRELLYKFIIENKNFNELICKDFKKKFFNITKKELNNENLNEFIHLSISDYLSNYESLNLVEQLEYIKKNKQIDLSNQISLVNGIEQNKLLDNIKIFGKEYNIDTNPLLIFINKLYKSNNIKAIESELINTQLFEKLFANDLKDIESLTKTINDINKTKSKLLYETNYDSIINPNKYSFFYKIGIINQDFENTYKFNGTSAASPQYQSLDILEKYKNDYFNNFKTNYREKKLNYNEELEIKLNTNFELEKDINYEISI